MHGDRQESYDQEPGNTLTALWIVLFLTLTPSLATFWLFGFEAALLVTLCLAVSIIAMLAVGLENTIIIGRKRAERRGHKILKRIANTLTEIHNRLPEPPNQKPSGGK